MDDWLRASSHEGLSDEAPLAAGKAPRTFRPSWALPATELAWLACTWPLMFAFGQHLLR